MSAPPRPSSGKSSPVKKKPPAAKVRLAVIGTGGMGGWHARNFSKIPGCKIVAACDIDAQRARAFADEHSIPACFSDVDLLLDQCDFDAVAIVTPDASHAPLSLRFLASGKHVLCEKPLALHFQDADKMARSAAKSGLVNMVNFSYRNWPCLQGAASAIARGDIGEVRHVEASYLQAWLPSKVWGDWRTNPSWLWRLSTRHGSKGVLGDVGVHILDFATYAAGGISEVFCRLKAFPKAPGNRIGEFKLDANDSATINAEFANGALGVIHTTRWAGGHVNRLALKISGTGGSVSIDSELSTTAYRECRGRLLDKAQWRDVRCPPTRDIYRRFIHAIRSGEPGEPDFRRGADIQRILDACFASDAARLPTKIPHPKMRGSRATAG